jgi:tRNA(fMet)-specific endonuclease VapC
MKNCSDVVERYRKHVNEGITISTITASELYYGVFNSAKPAQNAENLANFFSGITALNFTVKSAECYGKIRTSLKSKGAPIGELDMLIAAHALSEGLILVTNNTREFERVKLLKIEDWRDN